MYNRKRSEFVDEDTIRHFSFREKPMWVTLKDSFPLIESLHNHVMKTKPYLGSLGLRVAHTKVCTLPE
jgi:hypothetical protein